jgi:hypothetical protein
MHHLPAPMTAYNPVSTQCAFVRSFVDCTSALSYIALQVLVEWLGHVVWYPFHR